MSPTEGERRAERRGEEKGGFTRQMADMSDDITDLKEEQKVQGERQIEQGKALERLKTQMLILGALGPLVIGLILFLAQKGSP